VYTYDAAGEKLRKSVYLAGVLTTTIDYAGETEFYNSKLKFIHTEEGIVEYDPTKSAFTYEYYLKDHLGNTRATVFTDSSGNLGIGQVNDYYPFGMSFLNVPNNGSAGSDNKYLYNWKELQDDVLGGIALNWYDYGHRFYDPLTGRWTTPDPLTEINRKWSPYNYCKDNPVRFIDPDGMYSTEEYKQDNGITQDDIAYSTSDQNEIASILNQNNGNSNNGNSSSDQQDDPDKPKQDNTAKQDKTAIDKGILLPLNSKLKKGEKDDDYTSLNADDAVGVVKQFNPSKYLSIIHKAYLIKDITEGLAKKDFFSVVATVAGELGGNYTLALKICAAFYNTDYIQNANKAGAKLELMQLQYEYELSNRQDTRLFNQIQKAKEHYKNEMKE
jgi:RHS repeat-associated protein